VGRAVGDLVPYALGLADSPIAVIAIILMLLSKRGAANSTSFVVGWMVGVVGASAALLALSGVLGKGPHGGGPGAPSIVEVVLGSFLVLLAAGSFRKRPKPGEHVVLPKWLKTVDSLTPGQSAALGMLSPLGGGLNPTNVLLIAGAMFSLSQDHLALGGDTVAVLVFVLIGVSTVAAPVLIYRAAGPKARPLPDRLKAWLTQNNAVVTGAVLIVIGAVLLEEGVRALA
jgi:hypothetical protein